MDKEECREAIEAWGVAEKAYSDEAARYWSAGWVAPGESIPAPEKVLTPEALDEITRLRTAAEDAQRHYREVCWGS